MASDVSMCMESEMVLEQFDCMSWQSFSWLLGSFGLLTMQASKPSSWLLHKPPLRLSYGTHHSKAMFLIYPTGVRIVVHTANLIYIDWNNKSQGLWMQDFPFKSGASPDSGSSPFENDLVEYLQALQVGYSFTLLVFETCFWACSPSRMFSCV